MKWWPSTKKQHLSEVVKQSLQNNDAGYHRSAKNNSDSSHGLPPRYPAPHIAVEAPDEENIRMDK